MRPIIVTLALAGTVIAQDLGALPDCAKNCLAEFTTGDSIGNCARLDAKCICSSNTFLSGISCCLAGVCNAQDQQQAVNFAISFCSTQGVTNLPSAVTCATPAATSNSPPATNTNPSTPASTSTSTASPAATQNAGSRVTAGLGSATSFYGGILAALAML